MEWKKIINSIYYDLNQPRTKQSVWISPAISGQVSWRWPASPAIYPSEFFRALTTTRHSRARSRDLNSTDVSSLVAVSCSALAIMRSKEYLNRSSNFRAKEKICIGIATACSLSLKASSSIALISGDKPSPATLPYSSSVLNLKMGTSRGNLCLRTNPTGGCWFNE